MADTHERLIGRLATVLTTLRDVPSLADRLCEAGRQMMSAEGAAIILSSDGVELRGGGSRTRRCGQPWDLWPAPRGVRVAR